MQSGFDESYEKVQDFDRNDVSEKVAAAKFRKI
jgi:hypothetical protein